MAGSSAHEEVDHAFGLRGVMRRRKHSAASSLRLRRHQLAHRRSAQAERRSPKQLTSSQHQLVFANRVFILHDHHRVSKRRISIVKQNQKNNCVPLAPPVFPNRSLSQNRTHWQSQWHTEKTDQYILDF